MSDPNEGQFQEAQKQHEIMRQQVVLKDTIDQTYQRRITTAGEGAGAPVVVQDTKKTFSILSKCKKLIFPASAGGTAEGQPVMQQHKEKSWKDKRADEEHAEKAKTESQDYHADHYSYEIVEDLREKYRSEEAALAMYRRVIPDFDKKVQANHVDIRVIRMLAGTYKVDEKGMPVDAANAQLMDEERKRMEAYVSGDLEKRKPYLESLVKEIMDHRIEPSMMNYEYISAHAAEMKNLGDKMIYLENMRNDPINKPFFDDMEPAERELLEASLTIADAYTGLLDQMLKDKAINMNKYDYIVGEAEVLENYRYLTGGFKQIFENRVAERALAEQRVYEKYHGEAFRKAIRDCSNPNPDLSGKMDRDAIAELQETVTKKSEYTDGDKKVLLTRIEEADRQFDTYMAKGETRMADSAAKQAIGIRNSTQDSAIADKKMRGHMFDSLAADYKSFFEKLREEDLPFEDMSKMMETKEVKRGSPARMDEGGGVEAISVELLNMFKQRIVTTECAKYLYEIYRGVGQAKIFGVAGEENRIERVVSFQLQGLLNSHGASANQGVKLEGPLAEIAKGASRNLLGVYRLSEELKNPEDIERLKTEKPGVYELLKVYRDMASEITAMVTRMVASEQAAEKAAKKEN